MNEMLLRGCMLKNTEVRVACACLLAGSAGNAWLIDTCSDN